VEVTNTMRLRTRLLAIDIRLAELDQEMKQAQVRVHQLESQLDDAKLAKLMGDEAGSPAELAPELERTRGVVEQKREFIEGVKKRQWKARVDLSIAQIRERRAARELQPE
jgi:hypothetical protein